MSTKKLKHAYVRKYKQYTSTYSQDLVKYISVNLMTMGFFCKYMIYSIVNNYNADLIERYKRTSIYLPTRQHDNTISARIPKRMSRTRFEQSSIKIHMSLP